MRIRKSGSNGGAAACSVGLAQVSVALFEATIFTEFLRLFIFHFWDA